MNIGPRNGDYRMAMDIEDKKSFFPFFCHCNGNNKPVKLFEFCNNIKFLIAIM